MIKLFVGLPLAFACVLACALGGALLLPLLGLGIGLFALAFALGLVLLLVRVLAAVAVGIGGLVLVGLFAGGVIAGGAILLALGAALAHLIVPLLVIFGLVWLIRRLSRPVPPALGNA